jgi:hypothetical protein
MPRNQTKIGEFSLSEEMRNYVKSFKMAKFLAIIHLTKQSVYLFGKDPDVS